MEKKGDCWTLLHVREADLTGVAGTPFAPVHEDLGKLTSDIFLGGEGSKSSLDDSACEARARPRTTHDASQQALHCITTPCRHGDALSA